MLILTLKTDQPEAEIWAYEDHKQIAHESWEAHRELAETLTSRIEKILNKLSKSFSDIEGVVCFKGPGSFTGLRIGLSVANSLAYANSIPIVALSGDDWLESGIKELLRGKSDKIALPKYDRPAATTPPKS